MTILINEDDTTDDTAFDANEEVVDAEIVTEVVDEAEAVDAEIVDEVEANVVPEVVPETADSTELNHGDMTDAELLADAGFSVDVINATIASDLKLLQEAGFSEQEISDTLGTPNNSYVKNLANINQVKLSTVTDRLSSGYSPIITVGEREGRFNFDVPGREVDKTPGTQYLFEGNDGNDYWFQLENDYQGGRWDAADHAETNYNDYKTWGAEVRKELLNQMWEGSPQIAEFIDESVKNDVPWEEVKTGLQEFNTYRQISNYDVTGNVELDPEVLRMIEDKSLMKVLYEKGVLNHPITDVNQIPDDVDEETRAYMEKILKIKQLVREDPNGIRGKDWDMLDSMGFGYDNAVIGLLHELWKVKMGDEDAIANAAEMMLAIEQYADQDWWDRGTFRITSMLMEAPIMLPAAAAAAWACAPAATAVSVAATPVAGAVLTAGCSFGGAFAAPAILRDLVVNLMDEDMGIVDSHSAIDLLVSAANAGKWEFVIGALTGFAGKGAELTMKAFGVTSKTALIGGTVMTEAGTMTTASSVIHGSPLSLEHFLEVTVDLLVFRGATKGYKETKGLIKRKVAGTEYYINKNLKELYRQSGIDPRMVAEHIKNNPELAKELAEVLGRENFVMPEYYLRHVAEVMNRMEQVSRSTIKTNGTDFKVSRYYDANKGEMEVLTREVLNDADGLPFKITFKITENGNWTIKDVEGEFNTDKAIHTIANFAESKGRIIERTDGFDQIYNIIESRSKTDTIIKLSPEDLIAKDILDQVKKDADSMREVGRVNEAVEIESTAKELLDTALGKEFVDKALKNVEEYNAQKNKENLNKDSNTEFQKTGFYKPEVVFADTFGRIDKLDQLSLLHDQ